MVSFRNFRNYIMLLIVCILSLFTIGAGVSLFVTTLSDSNITNQQITVVIDAGHGGEDGGTTSCTGMLESYLNLEIAKRLNDLMHLLGVRTVMVRESDISVYKTGNSLSEKKISDLKQRILLIQDTPNPVLISLHQNYYPDSRYYGAQVFYATSKGSKELAGFIQNSFKTLNSNRNITQGSGIYLMEKISCPGILVECGFLSNPEEEAKIRDPEYQKQICCAIVSGYRQYLHQNESLT